MFGYNNYFVIAMKYWIKIKDEFWRSFSSEKVAWRISALNKKPDFNYHLKCLYIVITNISCYIQIFLVVMYLSSNIFYNLSDLRFLIDLTDLITVWLQILCLQLNAHWESSPLVLSINSTARSKDAAYL